MWSSYGSSRKQDLDLARRYGAWALIAGASEGLGAAYARALARSGMNLVLVARRRSPLETLAAEVRDAYHIEVRCYDGDLACSTFLETLQVCCTDLDLGVVVCNAAQAPIGDFASRATDDLMRVVDVNVRAPLVLLRTFIPQMQARRRGAVLLMTSFTGNLGTPRIASYAASKAFLRVLGESLWYELKDQGIDVLACVSGAVRTPGYAMAAGKDAPGYARRGSGRGAGSWCSWPWARGDSRCRQSNRYGRHDPAAAQAGRHRHPGQVDREPCRHQGDRGETMNDFAAGFFAPWVIYAVMLGLHLALPAHNVAGYVRDEATQEPLRYRLNGLPVLGALVVLWVVFGVAGVLDWDWLYVHRWSGLVGSVVLGLLLSIATLWAAPPTGRSFIADFYFGRAMNLQYFGGGTDVKMFLYLVGAAMLGLNLLSFTAHHLLVYGSESSPGVVLYCVLFFWFITEYLFFERVHLYTYDIFAERIGFKLVWGCFTFYPYFYLVGLWATAHRPDPGISWWMLLIAALVFFAGWTLARGANMQKYYFKTQPDRAFLGFMRPEVLTDGRNSLLCSGFWSVSRHVNYLGEILQAVGLTLALGYSGVWLVWLYPLFYVFLLFTRERADDRRCSAKYGDLWTEYVRRVPRRIIPWVY